MERLNKIFAEWAKQDKKTELASEKVELGLIDEFKALKNASKNFKNQSDDNIKEAGVINRNGS